MPFYLGPDAYLGPTAYLGGPHIVTKQTGLGDRLFIAGHNLSGDIGSIGNIGGGPAALDVTGIDKEGFERIGGLRDGHLEYSAWWNPTGAHPVLSALPTSNQVTTYCRGLGIGKPAAGLVGKQINYDPTRGNDGALSLAVNVQAADGTPVEWGVQGTDGIVTHTGAGNGTAVDNAGATSFGLSAYLHVFALTGTSCTVAVHDSADGTTFNPLAGGAFAAATGVGAQRIATAPTAPIRRYLRVATTGTFTSCSFAVLLVRHEVASL